MTARPFDSDERERFHNLLKLAAESPFEGERRNALAAADRMATRHGMTLEEAAVGGGAPAQEAPQAEPEQPSDVRAFAHSLHLMDYYLHVDKLRRDAAMKAARERGLDPDDGPPPALRAATRDRRASRRRMNPMRHAAILLRETSLPFEEVAQITGLDVYKVVGMKLKMRAA